MATKSSLPNQNAYMNIREHHIDDLNRLGAILRTTFGTKSGYNNLTKIARIPEAKVDQLLKLVDITVNNDRTMKVGRFTTFPTIHQSDGIRGEVLNIVPAVTRRAGKTKKRRRNKSKGTRRR